MTDAGAASPGLVTPLVPSEPEKRCAEAVNIVAAAPWKFAGQAVCALACIRGDLKNFDRDANAGDMLALIPLKHPLYSEPSNSYPSCINQVFITRSVLIILICS